MNPKTKKVAGYLLLVTAVNQVSPAIVLPAITTYDKTMYKEIVVENHKLKPYQNAPADFNTLDYLNLASSLVAKEASEKGDCEDAAYATYDTFLKLIEKNSRTGLKETVRVAAGSDRDGGHVIIEFEDDNSFIPYETIAYTPSNLNLNEVKEYSRKNEKIKYLEVTLTRSVKGGNLFYPTFESIGIPGGLARILYDGFSQD